MSLQEKLQNSGLRYGGLVNLPNTNPYQDRQYDQSLPTAMRNAQINFERNSGIAGAAQSKSDWMQGYQSQQMANASGGTGPSAVSNIMNKAGSEVASMVAQDIANAVGKAASEAASAYTNGGAPRLLGSTI